MGFDAEAGLQGCGSHTALVPLSDFGCQPCNPLESSEQFLTVIAPDIGTRFQMSHLPWLDLALTNCDSGVVLRCVCAQLHEVLSHEGSTKLNSR